MKHLLMSGLLLSGCAREIYGECEPPKEQLQIVYKPLISAHPFSHSYCIVCNPDLAPSEYEDWAISMGAPQGPGSSQSVHPCLYAYAPGQADIDSYELCESLICDEIAEYNDLVGKNNSNVELSPAVN